MRRERFALQSLNKEEKYCRIPVCMYRLPTLVTLIFLLVPLYPCQAKEQEYLVTKVIDGNTILLENGSVVRYLGVSAPHLHRIKVEGDFFARETVRENKSLVLLKKVRLEFDVEKKDSEGRLLAYVSVEGLFVNGELIRPGYARAAVSPPNVRYRNLLLRCEKDASKKYLGLWQESKAATEQYYVGNKRSYIFHRPSCTLVSKSPARNKIVFRTRTDPYR